jgi:hypothetical protein
VAWATKAFADVIQVRLPLDAYVHSASALIPGKASAENLKVV